MLRAEGTRTDTFQKVQDIFACPVLDVIGIEGDLGRHGWSSLSWTDNGAAM
jgi:hypothetical protein